MKQSYALISYVFYILIINVVKKSTVLKKQKISNSIELIFIFVHKSK